MLKTEHTPFKVWLMAIRPKTLGAAVAPVLIGSALAWRMDRFNLWAFLAAFLGALWIQIGTNLANDYFDFLKGADTQERLGPTRVTQAGLLSPRTVRNGFIFSFGMAVVSGLYLVYSGGWPVLLAGTLSILSGILYTGGPFPLAYNGLGDIFVLLFFGFVATVGSFFIHTHSITTVSLLAAIGPGLLATAILVVNNLRDLKTDAEVNKNTLVVRFGAGFARAEYLFCIGVAFVMPLVIFLLEPHPGSLLACGIFIPAIPAIRAVLSMESDPRLNPILGATNRLLLLYSVLFSLGWILT